MSWNFTLVAIPRTSPDELGATDAAETSFDEASSSTARCPSAAAVGETTLVVDPTMTTFELPAEPVPGTVVVEISGVSDTYTFRVLGEAPRFRVVSAGEIVEDEGEPVPAESDLDGDGLTEDAHLELFCRLAGISERDLWDSSWAPLAARRPRRSLTAWAGRWGRRTTSGS